MSNAIDFYLSELKRLKGIKVPEFAESCGLKPSTVYGIRQKPSLDNVTIEVFLKIAHGLGMTADDLYYEEGSIMEVDPDGTRLTDDEMALLRAYRVVDAKAKRRIMRVANGEVDDMSE